MGPCPGLPLSGFGTYSAARRRCPVSSSVEGHVRGLTWGGGHRVQSNDGLGGLEFEEDPGMGCKFARYTRRQVLQCMKDRSIMFLGDSMVRSQGTGRSLRAPMQARSSGFAVREVRQPLQ